MISNFDMVSYIKEGLAIGYAILAIICFTITKIYPDTLIFGWSLFAILSFLFGLLSIISVVGSIKAANKSFKYMKLLILKKQAQEETDNDK